MITVFQEGEQGCGDGIETGGAENGAKSTFEFGHCFFKVSRSRGAGPRIGKFLFVLNIRFGSWKKNSRAMINRYIYKPVMVVRRPA